MAYSNQELINDLDYVCDLIRYFRNDGKLTIAQSKLTDVIVRLQSDREIADDLAEPSPLRALIDDLPRIAEIRISFSE